MLQFQSCYRQFCSLLPDRKIQISSFTLSMFLTTLGVFTTTLAVLSITSVFGIDAARHMAEQVSNVMIERTTLRIKGVLDRAAGVANASQGGLIVSPRALMPSDDSPNSWYQMWLTYGVTSEKALSLKAHAISYFFDDGSYVVVSGTMASLNGTQQRRMLSAILLGNNEPPVTNPYLRNLTTVLRYDYATMAFLSSVKTISQVDSRLREGYNRSMPAFSSSWSPVVMSFDGKLPTVKLSYSMFNASFHFLGIGEVQLRLDSFDEKVKAQMPTPNTNVFILDRQRNLIASNIKTSPVITNRTVSITYNLTKADSQKGCSLIVTLNQTADFQFLICLKNPETFVDEPLRVMGRMGLIQPSTEHVNQGCHRMHLEGLGYFYVGVVDYNKYYTSLDWIALIIIPETEILHGIIEGRNIAIGVSFTIAVVVAIGNGFLIRLLLRPLAEIVFRMKTGAYLKEDTTGNATSGDTSTENGGTDTESRPSQQQDPEIRRPSYLSDVAAIQTAYWDMADELGILRGYIPEHIRDQLLATRRKSTSGVVGTKAAGEVSAASCNELMEFDADGMTASRPGGILSGNGSPGDSINECMVSTSSGLNVSGSIGSRHNSHSHQQHGSSNSGTNNPTNKNTVAIAGGHVVHSTPLTSAALESAFEPLTCTLISEATNTNTISRKSKEQSKHSSGDGKIEGPLNDGPKAQVHSDPEENHLHFCKNLRPVHDLPPLSAKASTRQAAKFASLGNISEMNDARPFKSSEPLPLFTENGLVERNITVALINLTGFHNYVFSTPTSKVIKEHEYFVNYLHEVAKRCGGVLDNFNGDKFWVSFNASAPCDEIYVAATLFAYEVASKVNREASLYQQYLEAEQLRPSDLPPLSPQRPKFHVALRGVTIGVATGQAFVGPLGTKNIRRLTITSNALSEASALERMAARYPDCGVMVGGDMIPAIEGYFQYMLLDATALPGSGGLRRRIASIKGNMLAPHRHHIPFLLSTALKLANPLPSVNPFDAINDCFNAFLEGRVPEVVKRIAEISNYLDLSRQVHHAKSILKASTTTSLPDGRAVLTASECDNISIMIQFMSSVGDDVDGRQYRSPLGDLFEGAP